MKKDKKEIVRLKNLIESDRFVASNDFGDLVLNDFSKLISDYFDLKGSPQMEIVKETDKFKVFIKFEAFRIKSFGSLPK